MNEHDKILRLGLDVGSTTAKMVLIDDSDKAVMTGYERHNADTRNVIRKFLTDIRSRFPQVPISVSITGSVGMGLADCLSQPFTQEVIGATAYVKRFYPQVRTMIDIGGEDAKIVYLKTDGNTDLRMNGNCAGGTGAFIDQMAILLGVDVSQLDRLASDARQIHPIASRCGVFSKTDVQNLISRNVSKADIAASIFHAIAVQTIVTLSHGCELLQPILLCGGPLSFLPSLRKAFARHLNIEQEALIVPPHAELIPAYGTALHARKEKAQDIGNILAKLDAGASASSFATGSLPPLFTSEEHHMKWCEQKRSGNIRHTDTMPSEVYLGIDSGSTTTKIVVTDKDGNIAYGYYHANEGDPIEAVKKGLGLWREECRKQNVQAVVKGSCVTGYGENLIKAAFKLDSGIIETIAHFTAARRLSPEVTFILDIGGQDMKAIFVDKGVISRMELNEACSSGCGSFIETFARSLGHSVSQFAEKACQAQHPCDLGTRCTVFMNSKVKQVLRENATVGDISAGLAYSVVKNALYKVLKLHDPSSLGAHVVMQGGCMRNDAVVRAFELLTGANVYRSSIPELMGAYGCALFAAGIGARNSHDVSPEDLMQQAEYTQSNSRCSGCENRCFIEQYRFGNGNRYVSGNKCERIFTSSSENVRKGENIYPDKYKLLFNRSSNPPVGARKIGIPRCLNMYEEYPFWHTLLSEAGFEVVLSAPSTLKRYEACAHNVMSDNICFPAKIAHSHIEDLIERGVERILMPYVIFEKESQGTVNSYNCPIVTGYSDVIRGVEKLGSIPIDSPVISYKKRRYLEKQCRNYLISIGADSRIITPAFEQAVREQESYENSIAMLNRTIYERSRAKGEITILLAGRPYHTDPLIQHKLSEMIASLGVNVISDDIVRDKNFAVKETNMVQQWAYVNRILKAAAWVAEQDKMVHLVQMTSFGCGPDAFLTDEVRDMLSRGGKALTLLKIDDINNIGSMKLRVRSLVESLKYGSDAKAEAGKKEFVRTKAFSRNEKKRKILVPFFTDFVSPLIPSAFQVAGFEVETLPVSDSASADAGLKYANNEVCYPATLIVGDIVKALGSGRYDLNDTAVAITQTGGQCRATSYISLIKKALVDAGFSNVPVISVAMNGSTDNEQSGFKIPWMKVLPIALAIVLYADCISQFYYAARAREKSPGQAAWARDRYLSLAQDIIKRNKPKELYRLIGDAARDFDAIAVRELNLPKVGVVGEIYLKFNSFAHKNVVNALAQDGIEIMPPLLSNFFMQSFVNRREKNRTLVKKSSVPEFITDGIYSLIKRKIEAVNRTASQFRFFTPFEDIFKEADNARGIVSLSAQFGEGWELPAEIVSYVHRGVNNVICLQPFGCIANHIVAKGVEKKIKNLYPELNLLFLDFDSGVSDVNVSNRVLLFTDNLK